MDRLLIEQIGQRGQVELLRTYSKDQYHREGTKFLVLRLLPRGHILKGSKTRLCPTKKIWKLDYLSAAIVRRMGNNRLGVWSWKRLELMVTGSSVEQSVSIRKLFLEICLLQESAVFSCGAEHGRSARGLLRSPSTLDRLCSWLLWALHHQRGQEGNKAVQSSLYVFSFNSGSSGDFHYTRDRCLNQFHFLVLYAGVAQCVGCKAIKAPPSWQLNMSWRLQSQNCTTNASEGSCCRRTVIGSPSLWMFRLRVMWVEFGSYRSGLLEASCLFFFKLMACNLMTSQLGPSCVR